MISALLLFLFGLSSTMINNGRTGSDAVRHRRWAQSSFAVFDFHQGATSVGAWRIVSESGAEVAACDKAQRSL